jgi:uncharacterized protein Veg
MGCCEIKKGLAQSLEIDLNVVNENSFSDLSILSKESLSNNLISYPSIFRTSESTRVRSVSYNYPNILEQAFLINSPLNPRLTSSEKIN